MQKDVSPSESCCFKCSIGLFFIVKRSHETDVNEIKQNVWTCLSFLHLVQTYNLIPKAILSLKVLQELPIIVVLMYQLHKQYVHQEVSEFIPLIMKTITLQPSEAQRFHKNFNREVFVDFMGAQIKTLSFLAYIIRLYQEVVSIHATQMVKGILSLLTVCPHEVAHLRKELLIGK